MTIDITCLLWVHRIGRDPNTSNLTLGGELCGATSIRTPVCPFRDISTLLVHQGKGLKD